MQYVKKVLMLRRTDATNSNAKPLSVLARIEIESGVGEFYISIVNLPTIFEGANYYALVVDSDKNEYEFDLGARPTSHSKNFYQIPNVNEGVAIGLYCISNQIPITLAFANQGKCVCLSEFKKVLAERCLLRFKQSTKEDCSCKSADNESAEKQQEKLNQEILSQYNDEAVATENYYEIDDEIREKLLSIKEKESENVFFENEHTLGSSQKEKEEECPFDYGVKDEKDACLCQEVKPLESELNNDNYYDGVKDELDNIFLTYPPEENLEKLFSESRWAKIYYSKEKFYVVGLIFENQNEKFICYGVPSRYSIAPPKELKGYASFIPLSVFDMFGDGYFIMFQDAKSGRCVHFN